MGKFYTEEELKEMGMDDKQINAIMSTQNVPTKVEQNNEDIEEGESLCIGNKVVHMHKYDVNVQSNSSLIPTSVEQIATYKNGTVVELPPFADGQPFIVRITRPSMLALVKSGKIPNSLLNQATSLFANGTGALNGTGKNAASINELYEVVDCIVDAALLEPTLSEIRSVGMELTDDQLMAIFSYTQRGVKALEQFRTERTDT